MFGDKILIFGMSQNPDTKDYILVLEDLHCGKFCLKCFDEYTDNYYKWCKSCQINVLKANFTYLSSENEKIDRFIQKMQLKIKYYSDIVFEWIPYNQFNNIEEMAKNEIAIIYSATWIDGPLYHNKEEWKRNSDQKVALKCLYNSKNMISEILSEV